MVHGWTQFVPAADMHLHSRSPSAASPQTQPPVELFPQQVSLFADPLQHGAVLLGSPQQVRQSVVYGAVGYGLVHGVALFS